MYQIEFVSNGVVPCSLAPALVLNTVALGGLQERIKELQVEKSEQRDLYRQARQQHVQLIHDRKDMEAKIQSRLRVTGGTKLWRKYVKPILPNIRHGTAVQNKILQITITSSASQTCTVYSKLCVCVCRSGGAL